MESAIKRQHTQQREDATTTTTPYRNELQSIGMRIRKALSEGYQTPDNLRPQLYLQKQQDEVSEQQQRTQQAFSRVPLPSNLVTPPLLSNTSSSFSTYGSNLEEWEQNLENRLQTIEETMIHRSIEKRRFDSVDNDW